MHGVSNCFKSNVENDDKNKELSPREIQVARLMVLAKSNKEIGIELDISPRTVDVHISNIHEKIGGNRRHLLEVNDFLNKHHPQLDGMAASVNVADRIDDLSYEQMMVLLKIGEAVRTSAPMEILCNQKMARELGVSDDEFSAVEVTLMEDLGLSSPHELLVVAGLASENERLKKQVNDFYEVRSLVLNNS